jgi:hypothetical protein
VVFFSNRRWDSDGYLNQARFERGYGIIYNAIAMRNRYRMYQRNGGN